MTPPYLFISFTARLLTPSTRKRPPQSGSVQTGMWEVSAFSSYASICGDILISCGPRFSPYGDTVNLSRCFYCPAILTLCVNPQRQMALKLRMLRYATCVTEVDADSPFDRRDEQESE